MIHFLKHPEFKNLLYFLAISIFIVACSLKAGEIEKPAPAKEEFKGIPPPRKLS
jgi:hypothetical protein